MVSEIRRMEDEIKRYRKRKYSAKRLYLESKHKCHYDGCSSSYRSKTAMKSHIKKKHQKRDVDKNTVLHYHDSKTKE